MGLSNLKPEANPPQPDRNGERVSIRPGSPLAGSGGVHESLLAAIKKIVHDEVRLALQEAQTQTWIQKLRRMFL